MRSWLARARRLLFCCSCDRIKSGRCVRRCRLRRIKEKEGYKLKKGGESALFYIALFNLWL